MSLNTRLAAMLETVLLKHGFDATLQRQSAPADDFSSEPLSWNTVAVVRAVWDNPRRMVRGLNDVAPAATSSRYMTIAYRTDLKDPASAVGLSVIVNGMRHSVSAIGEIGQQVGLRLILDSGTEPA